MSDQYKTTTLSDEDAARIRDVLNAWGRCFYGDSSEELDRAIDQLNIVLKDANR